MQIMLSMAKEESKRSDGIEALGIMTPSGDHYKIAKIFIEKIFILFVINLLPLQLRKLKNLNN